MKAVKTFCIDPFPVSNIPPNCGLTTSGSQRVVNGLPAPLHAWPWMAALGYDGLGYSSGETEYLCGAALITVRHVVTAAHCIREDLTTVLLGVRIGTQKAFIEMQVY